MTTEAVLQAIRTSVQRDVGQRGLANLFQACPQDFALMCHSLAETPAGHLGIVTGFWIPGVGRGETDGPLGAVYLARTLPQLGITISLISDPFCRDALQVGLRLADCESTLVYLLGEALPAFTHLLAVERVGPSHTPNSVDPVTERVRFEQEVPPPHHNRCHSMRGIDITDQLRDAAALFESPGETITLGIGDGGNEIGMGKLPWSLIRAEITNGAWIACRVPTRYLLVAGISNWGAYALASGVAVLRGHTPAHDWYNKEFEYRILEAMVHQGALVDGVTGRAELSVDGLPFESYIQPLIEIRDVLRGVRG